MKILFTLTFLIVLSSCTSENWTSEQQDTFFTGCINEGGSKEYCECYMEKVMEKNPIADDANGMDYETKIELSKDCESK
jgi:hypothetical protein